MVIYSIYEVDMSNNRRFRNRRPSKVDTYKPPFSEEVLSQSTDILNLRENTKKLLNGACILTVRDVVRREDKDFYRISTFNKKNLIELKNALRVKGLHLKPETQNDNGAMQNAPQQNAPQNSPQKADRSNMQERRQGYNPSGRREPRENQTVYVETTRVVHPPKALAEPVKETLDIYVKINKNGKWGFKDREGKFVIEPIYDEVFNFKEDLCCVQKDELFGYIDRQGKEVIPPVYNCALSFSDGYACVYKGDKCGYINAKNEVIIDFKYDAGTPMSDGECRVKKDGKWGELHLVPAEDGKGLIETVRWII